MGQQTSSGILPIPQVEQLATQAFYVWTDVLEREHEFYPGVREALLRDLFTGIHAENVAAGWWTDLATGQRKVRNVAELFALIWSEIAEAYTSTGPDDKLPLYNGFVVEIADALVRLADMIGSEQNTKMALVIDSICEEIEVLEDDDEGDHDYLTFLMTHWLACFEAARKNRPFEKPLGQLFAALLFAADQFRQDAGEGPVDPIVGDTQTPVGVVFAAKVAFNRIRPDHKVENRMLEDGKKI